jgi:(1->4)-alpha-D-glucan 1-alpha-D-glucosylmutase
VDPDNRRPVDYAARRALLARVAAPLETRAVADIVRRRVDGRLKLLVTTRALAARQAHRTLYARGHYHALGVRGARAAHVFAFARRHGGEAGITIVPRLTTALVGEPSDTPCGEITWGDTEVMLPAELRGMRWADAFTGRTGTAGPDGGLRLADVLAILPIAILTA